MIGNISMSLTCITLSRALRAVPAPGSLHGAGGGRCRAACSGKFAELAIAKQPLPGTVAIVKALIIMLEAASGFSC